MWIRDTGSEGAGSCVCVVCVGVYSLVTDDRHSVSSHEKVFSAASIASLICYYKLYSVYYWQKIM